MKHLICLLLSFISLDGLHAQKVHPHAKTPHYNSAAVWRHNEPTFVPAFDSIGKATNWQGDNSFSVQLVSEDSNVKVYNGPLPEAAKYGHMAGMNMLTGRTTGKTYDSMGIKKLMQDRLNYGIDASPKLDTIGPQLRLVSDTGKGWNPASAMWVYEVRVYANDWMKAVEMQNEGKDEATERLNASRIGMLPMTPRHLLWLDSNKKPLKLKIWETR